MASMIDQLTNDIIDNIITQITSKMLPVISERYNIPLEELLTLVNNKTIKKLPKKTSNTIKATPKGQITRKRVSTAAGTNLQKLQDNIAKCQEQDKFFNVSSGRPLQDNTSNRKKYRFIDELGIVGKADDEKLTTALKLLGAPSKKELPVHKQAARAKAKAKKDLEEAVSESESENDSDDEPPAKPLKKVLKKPVKEESEDESDNDSEEEKPVKKPSKTSKNSKTKPVKEESEDESEESEDESDNDSEEEKPAKKPSKNSKNAKNSKTKPVKEESEDEDESDNDSEDEKPAKKISKKIVKKSPAKTSTKRLAKAPSSSRGVPPPRKAVKLSDIQENASDSDSETETTKKPFKTTYNKKLKEWWNPETQFVVKRKGVKHFIFGRVKDDKVVALSSKDIKKCKSNGWVVDTKLFKDK